MRSLIGALRSLAQPIRRSSSWAVGMLLLAASGVAVLPGYIHVAGVQGWASIAAGQSLASIGAVLVGTGWGITGPFAVASCTGRQERARLYQTANSTRGLMLIAVLPALLAIGVLAPLPSAELFIIGGLPTLAGAFSATFFFAGIAAPSRYLMLEVAPRCISTAVAAALLNSETISAVEGLLLQTAGVGIGVALSHWWIVGSWRLFTRISRAELYTQVRALGAATVAATVAGLPTLAVSSLSAPTTAATFALADRVARQMIIVASPAVLAIQGWLPARLASPTRGPSAFRQASATVGAIAALGSLALVVWHEPLFSFLGAERVPIDRPGAMAMAAFFASGLLSHYWIVCISPAVSGIGRVTASGLTVIACLLPVLWSGLMIGGATGAILGCAAMLSLQLASLVWKDVKELLSNS